MKTLVCQKITVLNTKKSIYVSMEPIYQAVANYYDLTGLKIVTGSEKRSSGICRDLNFHILMN